MKVQMYLTWYILEPIGRLMERFPEKMRKNGFLLGGAGLFFLFFLNSSDYEFPRYFYLFTAGCLALGLMILCTIPSTFQKIKLDKVLVVCWFSIGVFTLLSSLIYDVKNFSDAIMFLIVYPLAWFVWCQKSYAEIFRLLSKLCIGSFIVFFVVSAIFFPIHPFQYSGLMNNVNGAAFYLVLVFACLLVELLEMDNFSLRFWMYLALSGITTTLIFYTNSRTGQLACIIVLLVVSVLHLYNYRVQWKRQLIRKILPIIVSFLLFLPITVYFFQGVQKITHVELKQIHMNNEDVRQEEAQEIDVRQEEAQEIYGVLGFWEKNMMKTSGDGKSLDELSTGRLSIWKAFIKHVRPLGTSEEIHFYVESRDTYYGNAHNTPLEYAVHCGAICGILYFLFNILSGLKALKFAVKESKNRYNLLPIAVTMAFGVCSMLGSLRTPFSYMLATYYFFIQAPLMFQISPE